VLTSAEPESALDNYKLASVYMYLPKSAVGGISMPDFGIVLYISSHIPGTNHTHAKRTKGKVRCNKLHYIMVHVCTTRIDEILLFLRFFFWWLSGL
jgi:hypothetical protein